MSAGTYTGHGSRDRQAISAARTPSAPSKPSSGRVREGVAGYTPGDNFACVSRRRHIRPSQREERQRPASPPPRQDHTPCEDAARPSSAPTVRTTAPATAIRTKSFAGWDTGARRRRGRRGGASPHRAAPPAGRHGPSSGVAGPRPGAKATESPPDPEGLQPPVNSGTRRESWRSSPRSRTPQSAPQATKGRALRGRGSTGHGEPRNAVHVLVQQVAKRPWSARVAALRTEGNAARCSHRPRPPPSPG